MCYFTSQHLRAEEIARQYGRSMDAVNGARVVLKQKEEEARQKAAVMGTPDKATIYDYRLNDGMYVSPAYSEPYTVVVAGSKELQVMRWGLIPYTASEASKERLDRQNLYKNAQAEHLFTTWPWRTLWARKRCVVPVTGFFEPHYGQDGKSWPYYIQRKDGGLFSIAALYDEWMDPQSGGQLLSFVSITIAASPLLQQVHNGGLNPHRMPLILPEDKVAGWLDPAMTQQADVERFLVTPDDTNLEAWPVRKKFNYGDPYDPTIIDRVTPVPETV